jgi:adenylate cyclase
MRIAWEKISPVVVVGLILTTASLALYILAPTFIMDISNKTYDIFLRHTAQDPKSDTVAIIDIDEASLKELGQFPWPRYLLAKLTLDILEDNASVLAFDIVFPEKDRTSPVHIKDELNRQFAVSVKFEGLPDDLNDFDEYFAKALKAGRTVIGCYMHQAKTATTVDGSVDPCYRQHIFAKGKGNASEFMLQADDITISTPIINRASAAAFFNALPDSDNIVRSNPLVWWLGDSRIYPSLALETLRLHASSDKCIVQYNENGVQEIAVAKLDVLIPTDQAGCLRLNYRTVKKDVYTGFVSSFPTYSALDVLTGKVPKGTFSNKIVFVGTSAVGLRDVKATPLSSQFSGVEIHATMVDNILAGDALRDPTWMVVVHVLSIIIIGVFLTIFISRGKSWLSFLVSVALVLVAIEAGLILMRSYHLVFVPAWVILSIAIIYPVLTTIKFWQEELQKKRVRGMFGTMVSTEVLHYLENNPGSFSLVGQRAEATMFFSDVAGFTTISEGLPPERLSTLLNRYLSPMTDIIMEHRGYVDKYEGDLIMAVWGVPYPMKDHAVQACLAALEQQEKLAQIRPVLRQEFGHDIYVRMGVNSGIVTAGNMGSDRKFQYTVMGDAVNQASRFEPTNKDYGSSIIIGETTYEEARDFIEARLLDKIIVVGKTKPIQIYELLAKKGGLAPAKGKVTRLYDKALRLHWERKWDEAIMCLDAALELDSQDAPSARLRERIIVYKESPPGDNWAGEYARTKKD